jgi:multidrug efflux pump subunit AcrA (membrane-fusion protein)
MCLTAARIVLDGSARGGLDIAPSSANICLELKGVPIMTFRIAKTLGIVAVPALIVAGCAQTNEDMQSQVESNTQTAQNAQETAQQALEEARAAREAAEQAQRNAEQAQRAAESANERTQRMMQKSMQK